MSKDQRFVIYATGHRPPDVYSRTYVPVFERADHARTWLMKFIAGKEHRFEGDCIILETDFTIKLRSEQWTQIMAAPIANEEVRADVAQLILRFKYGTWDEVHVKAVASEDDLPEDGGAIIAQRAPKAERTKRAGRPAGFVTITELCNASGMPAMLARAALRASGRPKPPYGWAFDPKEVSEIKRICGMK